MTCRRWAEARSTSTENDGATKTASDEWALLVQVDAVGQAYLIICPSLVLLGVAGGRRQRCLINETIERTGGGKKKENAT